MTNTQFDTSTLEAEIILGDAAAMILGKVALERRGFAVEVFDHAVDGLPDIWVMARHAANMLLDDFTRLVDRIVEPYDCAVLEYGYPYKAPTAADVMAAIGNGAFQEDVQRALGVDFCTFAPVLRELEQSGRVRRDAADPRRIEPAR